MSWVVGNFLGARVNEWWTPNEIAKALKKDHRTVQNMIDRQRYRPYETTYKGFRLEVAERRRVYCVRLVKDPRHCLEIVKNEVKEVQSIPEMYHSMEEFTVILPLVSKWRNCDATWYDLQRHLESWNIEKATSDIQYVKKSALEELNKVADELGRMIES